MKVYSGKGDAGETLDLSGRKVSKNDSVIHLLGTLDELNSHIGLVKAMLSNDDSWQFAWKSACNFMEKVQKNLMKMMSHVSDEKSEKYFFTDTEISVMEKEIDRISKNIPEHHDLIIPGKNIIEAQTQIARTIARRAERLFFAAVKEHQLCPRAGVYLNRLSD